MTPDGRFAVLGVNICTYTVPGVQEIMMVKCVFWKIACHYLINHILS
jgi:hypothetical protein